MKYLMLSFVWGAYCFLHSFLISIRFTEFVFRLLRQYYAFYRLFYVLVSFVLLVVVIRYSNQFDDAIIITYSPPWSILRYGLLAGSLLIFFWAFFFDYDALSFFGIRQIVDFLRPNKARHSSEIKRRGLLGLIRHPMYFALIIFLWCQTFKMLDVVVNALLTVYVIIGTILEERKLVREFGDRYVRYQHEVPMLIPFTKP